MESFVYSKYVRPKKVLEKNSGIVLMERSGYIPIKERIKAIMNAGLNLKMARMEQYHFPEEKNFPDDFMDPTIRKDYDIFCAMDDTKEIERRLEVQRLVNEKEKERRKVDSEKNEMEKENASEGGE